MALDNLTNMDTEGYKPPVIDTKIKMLISSMGSVDGLHTQLYKKGERYTVSETLAKNFIDAEKAELADAN
jgi:hypothetical protein